MRVFILLLPLTFITSSVSAQPLAVTNTFSNTTVADADQVNQNFADIEVWINAYLIVEGTNTALGREALVNTTTGSDNTAVGHQALFSNTIGYANTASGAYALYFNEDSNNNTASGWGALYTNTTGSENTASGAGALFNNTSGDYNTAIGYNALYSNILGDHNTALGYKALENANGSLNNKNTAVGARTLNINEGRDSTAVGYAALEFNITGVQNTAIGTNALNQNIGGQENTALGYQALVLNSSGNLNTAGGFESMKDNRTGNRNTSWGAKALYFNTAGNKNTAIGWQALGNSQGDSNTALGEQADVSVGAEDITNATAIGSQAKVDQSNKIQLGNPAVLSVATAGKLTTGSVIYPNTHGTAGQVLKTTGAGELIWADDVDTDTDTDTLATIICSAAGKVLMWNGSLWGCSADTFAARSEELEEKVASLQKQLQNQKEELLAVVQSQQEQMAAQQEQIAQLQRMVEHQFAAR